MEKYCGYEENVKGGGEYVEKNGYGFELFNFKNDGGKYYGYTAPDCKVNLNRISKTDINKDALGKYLDDVLVVFTCEGKNGKRVIAGFYKDARVYAEAVNDDRKSRKFNEKSVAYNLICDASNALLVPRDERIFEIPHSKTEEGGYGQHNLWYADEGIGREIKKKVLMYFEDIIANRFNDEAKYGLYDESKKYVSSFSQMRRSKEARDKCIELKGCYCNICGFDFQKIYGDLGKDYIEVHHIISIDNLINAIDYEGTDPKKDLIPLCSNCHSMIHREKPPYSPDEIKEIINSHH